MVIAAEPAAILASSSAALTVVTAADGAYWRCLYQFLRSAERRGLDARHAFLAYDLGMDEKHLAYLRDRFSWCDFLRFDFTRHPPHVGRELRAHAWKPLVIADAIERARGPVLWLDSATLFRSGLDSVVAGIGRDGFYCLKGQSTLGAHCDADILDALAVPNHIRKKREFATGGLGLDPGRAAARKALAAWRELSLDETFARHATATHKSDQALLSVVLYRMEAEGEAVITENDIDIAARHPVPWMTSRNKVPAALPLWADPLARAYYSAYKGFDRLLLRLRHWYETRIEGLERWPKEHFTVFVASAATGKVAAVEAPASRYYADSFLCRHQGRNALFFEEFLYVERRGRISCATLGEDLRPGPVQTVLDGAHHLSFPFLFEHGGALYMVPESSAERSIDLYRCEDFPARWTFVRTLIYGLDAADNVLLDHGGRIWLFTSVRRPSHSGRALAIFSSPRLHANEWRAHPVNARRLYEELPFGTGRNAGGIVRTGDMLLRPSQNNPNFYGESVRWMRIDALSESDYAESEFTGEFPLAALSRARPMHHISLQGGLIAWDMRDRIGLRGLAPAFRKARARKAALADLPADVAGSLR